MKIENGVLTDLTPNASHACGGKGNDATPIQVAGRMDADGAAVFDGSGTIDVGAMLGASSSEAADISDGGLVTGTADGQACAEMLADGSAAMGLCYNGRVYDVQQDGASVAIQWNDALVQADYLVIPRESQNVEAAMELIAYMTSAEHNARLSEFISYAPANAKDDVPASIEPDLVTT